MKLATIFYKLASGHLVQPISENNLLGFAYDKAFEDAIFDKYNCEIIHDIVKYGDLRLGLILKRLENESGLYDYWLEQYSKVYSPLGYYADFEEPLEAKYGHIFDMLVKRIKTTC